MKIIADIHTHSVACDHAYSTVWDNAAAAAKKGLKFIAMTEHCPGLKGSPTFLHFGNLKILPRYLEGVMLIKGAEVNIMDFDGALDLEGDLLGRLEWVIASYHPPTIKAGSADEHTRGWMNIANNPHVDVIGHCGAPMYSFEHGPVIKEFAKTGKIVEINSNSFLERPGSYENCRSIALLCAEHRVPVVVSSDAHYCGQVGRFEAALALLNEIAFPEELVLNASYERFLEAVRRTSGKTLTDEA